MLRILSYCLALWMGVWPVSGSAEESARNDVVKAAIQGNGERQWRLLPYGDGGIKRLEVSGPVYLNLTRDPGSPPCSQTRVRVDQNLEPYLQIAQTGDVLSIELPEAVVPSDWVEVRLFCTTVEQVKASNHAVVIMRSRQLNSLDLHADNALISVVGEVRRLNAVMENHSVLGLLGLDAEVGHLQVVGGSKADLRRNDQLSLKSDQSSKIYALDPKQPINLRTEVSPGVLLINLNVYIHDYSEAYYEKKNFSQVVTLLKASNQP